MTYEISTLPAVSLWGYTDEVASWEEIPGVIGPMFGRLLGAMQQLGLDPDQPTLAWYDMGGSGGSLGVGVEADELPGAAELGLAQGSLPAAPKALVRRYRGPIDGIQQAWQELTQELHTRGLKPAGPWREVYLSGSLDSQEPWTIDLQAPVS